MKTFCCTFVLLFCTIFQLEAVSSNIPKSRMRRLVYGQAAPIRKYPWQIQLIFKGQFACGGSIISNQWVLTAAHCLDIGRATDYVITVSSVHLFKENKYKIKEIKLHEDWSRRTAVNDIALAKIDGEFTFDEYTSAVKLVEPDIELEDQTLVRITGHGRDENAQITELLKEELLVIVAHKRCQELYNNEKIRFKIPDHYLCARYPEELKTTCNGDSGGPLVNDEDNIQVGVVSAGFGCKTKLPKLFTKVSNFRNWITKYSGV